MQSDTLGRRTAAVVVAIMACASVACSSGTGDETSGATDSAASAEGTSAITSNDETSEGVGEHAEGRKMAVATTEHSEGGERGEHAEGGERGEHEGEGSGEHDEGGEGGEGEESGTYIARGDTWDVTRNGARLVLAFDAASSSFRGRVENTTASTLCAVRVEVHLAGGVELGPTDRIDVRAGQSTEIVLPAGAANVETWTAHPEVASCSR